MNTDQNTGRNEKGSLIIVDELSEIELLKRLHDSFDNLAIPECHQPGEKKDHVNSCTHGLFICCKTGITSALKNFFIFL